MKGLILLMALSGAARAEWTSDYARQAEKVRAALGAGRRDEASAAVAALKVPAKGKPGDLADMLLKRAEFKAELEDLAGAEADERAALAADPRNFDGLCTLTQFLRERGRLSESLAVSAVLITVTEGIPAHNRAEKWLQPAETLMRLGRFDEAEADVKRALIDKPEDVPSLWLMAQVLLRGGRARDALPFADRMIAAAATPEEKAHAFSQRAQVREVLDDKAGAEEDVARALSADPDDHIALEARVQRLRADGRLAEALRLADQMIAAGRSTPPTRLAQLYEQRAQVKRMLGDAAGAEADLRAGLAIQPDSLPPLRTLADFLLDQGRVAEAADAATRYLAAAAESAPEVRADGLMLRARALDAAGRRADADADRAEARRLAPESAAALHDSARAALESGDAKSALAFSDRLVKAVAGGTAAERSDARAGRAAALLALGRRDEAEDSLKEAAELTPAALFPREELAVLALESGRFADAEKRAEELFSVAGSTSSRERAAALVLRARVRLARGRSDEAVDDLAAALAVEPDSRAGLWAMVEALSRAGRTDRALTYAQRLFAVAAAEPPGNAGALKTMLEVVEMLTRLGRADAALQRADALLARAAEIPPPLLAEAFDARADALAALGRDDAALADLDRAAAAAPTAREPRRRRARLLADLGRGPEALAAADALVALSSGAAPAQAAEDLLWRASRRAASGDAAGADADHAAAEAAFPGAHARDADAGVLWAAAAARSRGWPAAWALLEKLRAFPGAPAAARAALAGAEAESRWSHGGEKGARAALNAALAADAGAACRAPLLDDRAAAAPPYLDACVSRFPRDADLLNDRGVARWTAGKKEGALADFRAALAAKPGCLPAALSLASALGASGRAEEAAKVLADALALPQADPALAGAARAALAGLKPARSSPR